jgi:predicted CXXCH cytochrome family protein
MPFPFGRVVGLTASQRLGIIILVSVGVASALGLLATSPAQAQGPDNATCLACHANPDLTMTLPSGEPLNLFVDPEVFDTSVHGTLKLNCRDCHTDIQGYPHPPANYRDRRDVTLQNYRTCEQCHEENFRETLDSIHSRALAAGDRNAAVCSDCHTAHAVTNPGVPRTRIPQTCAQCHSTISDAYAKSVHGEALFADENPDVPTCVNCHGVHRIEDPRTARFRLLSPNICADCHTNEQMMAKYEISTDVLDTYVADFHGTTIELFSRQTPDSPSNKPVCYDCHGIHNIKATDDPDSQVFHSENLLQTCQQCHPDATRDTFAASWMGHYQASPEQYPLVYYINLFYWILVPLTVAGLVAFIGTDVVRMVRRRVFRRGDQTD